MCVHRDHSRAGWSSERDGLDGVPSTAASSMARCVALRASAFIWSVWLWGGVVGIVFLAEERVSATPSETACASNCETRNAQRSEIHAPGNNASLGLGAWRRSGSRGQGKRPREFDIKHRTPGPLAPGPLRMLVYAPAEISAWRLPARRGYRRQVGGHVMVRSRARQDEAEQLLQPGMRTTPAPPRFRAPCGELGPSPTCR